MKILWICQKLPSEADALIGGQKELKSTGGWILGMAGEIIKHDVKLAILASSPLVKTVLVLEGEKVRYYVLPKPKGRGDNAFLEFCRKVKADFSPDVVHIHGTEYIDGLLWINANGCEHTVVSLQGILTSCAHYYYYGMSQWDVLSNITLRDLYRGTLFSYAKNFERYAVYERDLLNKVSFAIGRTFWDKEQLWAINPKAQYFFNNEILRNDFYQGDVWQYDKCNKFSIFVTQASVPYKGLHQLIKALPIIKQHFPKVTVRVAGFNLCEMSLKRKVLRTGYGNYLLKLMRHLHMENIVSFLGPLNAAEMKKELLSANLFLLPSAIDNSPNALGEAQMLGVPCVASRVGGVAEMIPDKALGEMYRFSDVGEMAYVICKSLEDSQHFDNSKMILKAAMRHDRTVNSNQLLSIYDVVRNIP